jgi:hypothetical protein
MGLENFINRYKNVPDLRQVISLEKEREFPEMSYAGYIAMRFAESGAEGLRETEKEISSKGPRYNINPSDRNKLAFNYSAVVVGTILEFMADAANTGLYDNPGYVGAHNTRIKESRYYYPLYCDPRDTQVIKNEYWEQLRRLADEDPTLSAIFTRDYHLMTDFIQWHIEQVGNPEYIRGTTLPVYYSVASRLLTS